MSVLEGLPVPNTTTTATAAAQIPASQNGYISLPVTVDPNQLMADAFGFIALQFPGWQPYEGHLEVALVEALAQMVATRAQVDAQVPLSIFAYFGANLANLPPENGNAATASTTWTMVDSAGYTVPAGTVVGWQATGSSYVLFQTVADVTVTTGSTQATGVTIEAQSVGTVNNDLPAGPLVLVDSLAYVSSVVATTTSSGGADPETLAAYLGRLSNQLRLISPRPVLAADFAALSVGQQGTARALGIDNFNAAANMLTPPDDGTGTAGVGTWTGVTNATVTDTTAVLDTSTTSSLAVTATASGAFLAATGASSYPASAGSAYGGVVDVRAATTTEALSAVLRFFDGTGSLISTATGTAATDSTTAWTTLTVSGTAPANTATVELGVSGTAAASSEVHYVGRRALFYVPDGATLPSWSAGGLMSGQERTVTVVPVDANGDALSPAAMEALGAYLAALREINFVVVVAPPTYAAATVVAAVVVDYGVSLDTVQAAVQSALTSMLSPANWAGGASTPPVWLADMTLRYLDVANVILSAPGVHHIGSLTVNGGTSDVTFNGYAALPSASVSVTVTSAPQGT